MKILFVIILLSLCSGSYAQSGADPGPVQKMIDEEHKMTKYLQEVRNGQIGDRNDYEVPPKYYTVRCKVSKEDFANTHVKDSIRSTAYQYIIKAKKRNCDRILIRIATNFFLGE